MKNDPLTGNSSTDLPFTNGQCGYCRMPAQHVYAPMEIDHIIPRAAGGSDEEDNLVLACPRCNSYKSDQSHAEDPFTHEHVTLFHPRQQRWNEHFAWSDDGAGVIGLTACGRATIIALQMNNEASVSFRRDLVSVGWHPPKMD